MRIIKETNINFLDKKYIAIALSLIVIAVLVGNAVINGFKMGIDFEGGHLIHLKFNDLPEAEDLRNKLRAIGIDKAIIQTVKNESEAMIRLPKDAKADDAGSTEAELYDHVIDALRTADEKSLKDQGKVDLNTDGSKVLADMMVEHDPFKFIERNPNVGNASQLAFERYEPIATSLIIDYREKTHDPENGKFSGIINDVDAALAHVKVDEEFDRELLINTIRENSFIGSFGVKKRDAVSADVGAELGEAAIWAIVFSLAGILVYIWFRFNNRFSVAAIIALIHDVLITVGIFVISGREFNLPIVAAVLTIVGYSLNDTIVIFVRIRENLTIKRREAKENYAGILNTSINQTLSRTLLTSLTTMVVVVFLFVVGGTVINDFAFTLMVGVIVGTYSSIFVASPVLAIWNKITGTIGGAAKVKVKPA